MPLQVIDAADDEDDGAEHDDQRQADHNARQAEPLGLQHSVQPIASRRFGLQADRALLDRHNLCRSRLWLRLVLHCCVLFG